MGTHRSDKTPEKHDCKVNGRAKAGNSGAKNRRIKYYLTNCIRYNYISHPPSPSSTETTDIYPKAKRYVVGFSLKIVNDYLRKDK